MEWRLVKESLPDDMEDVFLYDILGGLSIGYYFKPTNCFIRNHDGFRLEEVSHWMQLPGVPIISLNEQTYKVSESSG